MGPSETICQSQFCQVCPTDVKVAKTTPTLADLYSDPTSVSSAFLHDPTVKYLRLSESFVFKAHPFSSLSSFIPLVISPRITVLKTKSVLVLWILCLSPDFPLRSQISWSRRLSTFSLGGISKLTHILRLKFSNFWSLDMKTMSLLTFPTWNDTNSIRLTSMDRRLTICKPLIKLLSLLPSLPSHLLSAQEPEGPL